MAAGEAAQELDRGVEDPAKGGAHPDEGDRDDNEDGRDDLHRAAKGTAHRDTKDHREGQRDGQHPDDHREEHAVPDAPVGASDA